MYVCAIAHIKKTLLQYMFLDVKNFPKKKKLKLSTDKLLHLEIIFHSIFFCKYNFIQII